MYTRYSSQQTRVVTELRQSLNNEEQKLTRYITTPTSVPHETFPTTSSDHLPVVLQRSGGLVQLDVDLTEEEEHVHRAEVLQGRLELRLRVTVEPQPYLERQGTAVTRSSIL